MREELISRHAPRTRQDVGSLASLWRKGKRNAADHTSSSPCDTLVRVLQAQIEDVVGQNPAATINPAKVPLIQYSTVQRFPSKAQQL